MRPSSMPVPLRRSPRSTRRRTGYIGLGAVVVVALGHSGRAFMGLLKRKEPAPLGRRSPGSVAAEEGEDPTLAEFASSARRSALHDLDHRWSQAMGELREGSYPEIDRDPFFTSNVQGLLRRYLLAASLDVDDALKRLRATAAWRREWDVLSYYKPGAARELFAEVSNPGAEMYFADSLAVDLQGRPYIAGRLRFANAENMHPWRHLRAGVLVFEMLATKVAAVGRGPASYILDIGGVGGVAGNVSGTGGLDRSYDEGLNPYYAAGAGSKDAPSPILLEELGSLDNGFAVLKAAIQILNRHYPGIVGRVYYLNSDMLFWGAFKIFSRWIADRGSIEFNFLGSAGWREEPVSKLLEAFAPEQLCPEWGGAGVPLDGDAFLERAVAHYEEQTASAP